MKMKMKRLIQVSALVASSLACSVASASLVTFTLTGDYAATWQLDTAPMPDTFLPGGAFALWDTAGAFPGAASGKVDLTFFNTALGGGLNLYDFLGGTSLLSSDGPQLYSGPESNPTFLLGTFELTQFQGSGRYSLTIADANSVPEPTSIALALAAFGALVARRKFVQAA